MTARWRFDRGVSDPCWFHLHTSRTHGTSTPSDYFREARRIGLSRLVFLEHVRAQPTYDPEDFRQEILQASERYGMQAQVGFEARILRGGRLDISTDLLSTADVVGIAEHRYEGDGSTLAADFRTLVLDTLPSYPKQTFVWVHPGSWLQRHAWSDPGTYQGMLDVASRAPLLIERNLKHNLIHERGVASLPRHKVVIGLDAHSVDEAVTRWKRAGEEMKRSQSLSDNSAP
jgi:hypothetical protein